MTQSSNAGRKLARDLTAAAKLLQRDFRENPDQDWNVDVPGLEPKFWEQALLEPVRDFLARPGKGFRASMVNAAWHIAGGQGDVPEELPMAVELLHAGSLIIDDVQDQSTMRRGSEAVHLTYGVPTAINSGNWLYFWPLTLLSRAGFTPPIELALLRATNIALLRCHQGQALDLSVRVSQVSQHEMQRVVATTTELKTASLLELSAALGSIAAGAPPKIQKALIVFSRSVGVALQKLDDFGSILCAARRDKGHEDLTLGRPTWAWAYLAEHMSEVSFAALQSQQRAVVGCESSDQQIEQLLQAVASNLGGDSVVDVSSDLDRAHVTLRESVPASAALDSLHGEIQRLRKAYV